MYYSYAGTKCAILINYVLISVVVTIIFGFSTLTVDYAYAQKISPSDSSSTDSIGNSPNNNNTEQTINEELGGQVQKNQQPTILEQQQSQTLPSVKITSHTQNQEVPAGTLTIHGISSDTPSDTCTVYLILNNIKPYQKVIPTAKENGQSNDFSTWNYTFTPQYAAIKEGNNKMTSKISCNALATGVSHTNSNLTKFNSLNVTR